MRFCGARASGPLWGGDEQAAGLQPIYRACILARQSQPQTEDHADAYRLYARYV